MLIQNVDYIENCWICFCVYHMYHFFKLKQPKSILYITYLLCLYLLISYLNFFTVESDITQGFQIQSVEVFLIPLSSKYRVTNVDIWEKAIISFSLWKKLKISLVPWFKKETIKYLKNLHVNKPW